jgi:ABC-type Fe3+-hydroxamate transport system substrate-binding protein
MRTLADQLGNSFVFEKPLKRIVSLVPSQTELLCDLGLEGRLVGITKFCVHPYHLKSTKTIVGGTKQVKFDKIAELKPDIIIANKEENTPEIVAGLESICPVWVTDIVTVEDNFKMISDFGQLFNCRTESQKWIDKIGFAYREFQQFVEEIPEQKVAYFIWKNPYMAVGENNFVNEMLKLNHFKNIYDGNPRTPGRYPEVIIQKLRIQGDPDIVFLSSEPYPFKDEDAFEIGRFTHHAKVVFVDGEMFSWYGSRLVKAFSYFKNLHQRLADGAH